MSFNRDNKEGREKYTVAKSWAMFERRNMATSSLFLKNLKKAERKLENFELLSVIGHVVW